MNFSTKTRSVVSATALALLLPVSAAHALDLDRFSTSLKTALQGQGMVADWASVAGDEAVVTLSGVTVKFDGVEEPVKVGDVTMEGVTEESDHYLIEKAALPNYSITEEGMKLEATGMTMSNLELPFDETSPSTYGVLLYESADLKSLTVEESGKQLFTLRGLNFTLNKPESGTGPLAFTGSTEEFSADLSGITDPQTKAIIDQMGYQQISGDLELNGSWNVADGRMIVDHYDMSVDNAGTFGMTFDVAGYTPAFIKELRETTEKMAKASEEEQSAQGIAMLGLMQQLTFNSASIRFDDESLTSKVLEVVAKGQNTTPSAIANQAKAIVPFGLAQLNLPDFAQAVSKAVNTYLDDPKSIEIKAAPPEGVPFAQIVATGMGTPQALIPQLNVTVTAND